MRQPQASAPRIAVAGARAALADRRPLAIEPGEVHVWAMALAAEATDVGRCLELLGGAERARAERFVHAAHRDEFVVAHGLLRHLLSRYLGGTASAIRFGSGAGGKPFVEHPVQPAISFNLSHSGGRAVIAVGDGREIGVDVERERPLAEALDIAGTNFSRSEVEAIRRAPALRQGAEFFRYWVAKEAVAKAEGSGLGLPFDAFEIRFDDADGSRAGIRAIGRGSLQADWTVRLLSLGPGWPVAVSARGLAWRLCCLPGGADDPGGHP